MALGGIWAFGPLAVAAGAFVVRKDEEHEVHRRIVVESPYDEEPTPRYKDSSPCSSFTGDLPDTFRSYQCPNFSLSFFGSFRYNTLD